VEAALNREEKSLARARVDEEAEVGVVTLGRDPGVA
jgi:hypothetical protein